MMITIRRLAEDQISEAYQYYESQRGGLGEEFFSAFEATLGIIERYPQLYPIAIRDIRRAALVRFPYSAVYVVGP